MAMGQTLASPDEEYWAALTQWKTASILADSGCTDHIVTNIDAFLNFVTIQSVVRNPNGEASRVVGRGLKQRGISMRTQKCFVCAGLLFKPLISLKMHGVGT